jgi:hypothetical protein
MKTTQWMLALLAICVVAAAGCNKEEGDAPGPIPVYYGVKMEHLPKMDTEFTTASPEIRASVAHVKHFHRFAQFPQALAELSKLSKNPALTEAQKDAVNGLLEETKQVVANSTAPPGN